MTPWKLSSSEVFILGGYSGKITGAQGNNFIVALFDSDGAMAEGVQVAKREFVGHPIPPSVGMPFGLVIFQRHRQAWFEVKIWPVSAYWHESLRALVIARRLR